MRSQISEIFLGLMRDNNTIGMVAKENRTNNNNNSSLYRAKFYILSDYRQDKGVARGTIRHKIIKRGGLKQLMVNLNKANLVMK